MHTYRPVITSRDVPPSELTSRRHACGNILSPPLNIPRIATRRVSLNRRIETSLFCSFSLPLSSLLFLYLSLFFDFSLSIMLSILLVALSLFLFLIYLSLLVRKNKILLKYLGHSQDRTPWLFRDIHVSNRLRHRYKFSRLSSFLAFIIFYYRTERRAAS